MNTVRYKMKQAHKQLAGNIWGGGGERGNLPSDRFFFFFFNKYITIELQTKESQGTL